MDDQIPDIKDQPEHIEWHSADGKVTALLRLCSPTECTIKLFHADPERQGHGRRALQELCSMYSFIRAASIGDEIYPTRQFWLKMRDEGLVDELRDDNGCVVPPNRH